MRKKYLSSLLFGALIAASASTFTSCSDYDDDINNLQEQIDATNSNVPTLDVMKEAINAAKADLQSKIDAADNQSEVDALKTKVEALEGLESRINALETKLGRDYLTKAQVESLIGTKVNAAVDALYKKDGNTYSGAIVTYIQSVLAAETVSKTDFNSLKTAWDKFVKDSKNTTLKDIESKLSDLELFKTAIGEAMKAEEYKDFAAVLAQIDANAQAIAAIAIPEVPGDTDILDLIKTELEKEDGVFKAIQTKLQELGIDVESLKSMIQSIVFMPATEDGKVAFTTLNAKMADGEWAEVGSSKNRKLQFRVSPASAAENIENYNIALYSHEVSRSGNAIEVASWKSAGNGVVEVELTANDQVKNYAVCLHVTPKEGVEGNSDKNTDITSDYFIVNTGSWYLQNIKYVLNEAKDYTKLEIVDNTNAANSDNVTVNSLDFKGGSLNFTVSADKEATDELIKSASELGISEDLFTVEFSGLDAEEDVFQLAESVLSLKEGKNTPAQAGETVTLSASVNFSENADKYEPYSTEFAATYVYYIKNMDVTPAEALPFYAGSSKRYKLTDEEYAGIKYGLNGVTDYASETTHAWGNGAIRFGGNMPIIYVESATAEGAEIKGSMTRSDNEYLKVNLKAKVEIDMTIDAAIHTDGQWKDGNIFIPFSSTDNTLVYNDLSQIFSNYAEINGQVTEMGGTLAFVPVITPVDEETVPATGLVTVEGNKMTIAASNYEGETIGVKLQAVFGETKVDIENSVANIKIFDYNNLSGEVVTYRMEDGKKVEIPNNLSFTKPEAGATVAAKKAYHKDWKWNLVDGNKTTDMKNNLSALNWSTEVVLEGEAAEWFVLDGEGFNTTINVNPEKWKMTTLLENKVFNITIKFYTPWKSISASTKAWDVATRTIKVTINRWNENVNE